MYTVYKKRQKVKREIDPNPIGSITPRGTSTYSGASLGGSSSFFANSASLNLSGRSPDSPTSSLLNSRSGKRPKGGIEEYKRRAGSPNAFPGHTPIHIPPPPSAERGASKPFLNKPTLPTHSFFLPALPAKNVVIASEQPVSARDTAFPPAFAALEKYQLQNQQTTPLGESSKASPIGSSASPTTPRIQERYQYPDPVAPNLSKVVYELCLDATVADGHLLMGGGSQQGAGGHKAVQYCKRADTWNATEQDQGIHEGCLHTKEKSFFKEQLANDGKKLFLLPERCGELTGGVHDAVLPSPRPVDETLFSDQPDVPVLLASVPKVLLLDDNAIPLALPRASGGGVDHGGSSSHHEKSTTNVFTELDSTLIKLAPWYTDNLVADTARRQAERMKASGQGMVMAALMMGEPQTSITTAGNNSSSTFITGTGGSSTTASSAPATAANVKATSSPSSAGSKDFNAATTAAATASSGMEGIVSPSFSIGGGNSSASFGHITTTSSTNRGFAPPPGSPNTKGLGISHGHSGGGGGTVVSLPPLPVPLNTSTFAKALLRLDIRPAQIQRVWEMFEGDRTGFVAVKTVISALETVLTDTRFSEHCMTACFSLFTRPESQGVVLKEDLDSKRVAVTERGGCTRAMIVSLTRAIAQCQRFPSDRRRFISSVEFRRFMLGEEGTLSGELVVAFLPRIFQAIEEMRVLQRRGEIVTG